MRLMKFADFRAAGVAEKLRVIRFRDLFLPGLPVGQPSALSITTLPLDQELLAAAAKTGRSVAVVLGSSLALERTLTLPDAAIGHAEGAIRLELARTLPARAAGLLWTYSLLDREKGKARFRVWIVKEGTVQQALAECARVGLHVASVHVGNSTSRPVWHEKTEQKTSARTWVLASAMILLLVAGGQAWTLNRRAAELEELTAARQMRVRQLEGRLAAIEQQADDRSDMRGKVAGATGEFRLERQRLQVLTDIARLLPDQAWVSELTISANKLTITGFSTVDVTQLVTALQAAPWAKNATLEGAVTQDVYSGQSRFGILVELQTDEGSR